MAGFEVTLYGRFWVISEAPATIHLRLAAVRLLAYEAADWGLLSADLEAGSSSCR
jgi:hypothetical protein